jgi:hypothetical protein
MCPINLTDHVNRELKTQIKNKKKKKQQPAGLEEFNKVIVSTMFS